MIDLQLTDDNRILIAGNFSGRLLFSPGLMLESNGFASDIFAALYDLDGTAQSVFKISNPGNDVLMSVQNSGSGWIMSGTFDKEFLWEDELFETPTGSRSGFVLHLDSELETTFALNIAASQGFLGRSVADAEGGIRAAGISIPELTTFLGQEFIANGIYKGVLVVYRNKPNSIGHTDKSSFLIKIYPNPAGRFVHVEAPEVDRVTLFNLAGLRLGSWNEVEIQLPELLNGHYILTVEMKDGSRYSELIQIIN